MQLLLYPILVFIISFIVQILLIEKKRKNKNARERDINIEKEHKWNIKRLIKIVIAFILSFFLAIITLYGLVFVVLTSLQEGR